MNLEQKLSDPRKLLVMLNELKGYLNELAQSGKTTTLFLAQAGLTDQEQVDLLEYLAKGEIEISLPSSDEPVNWYETSVHGIWVGTFLDNRGGVMTRTIEVCYYPELAHSYTEDLPAGAKKLESIINVALQEGKAKLGEATFE